MNWLRNFVLGLLLIGLIISTVQAAPPNVEVVTPNGGSIPETINIEANATDSDGYIEQVKFSYNNNGNGWVEIGFYTSSSGDRYYINNWDTTKVTNGNNYSFKAEATDNNSETANDTSDAAVIIANNQEPIVSLVSPSSGETVNKIVILNATATDSDGSISNVTFEYKLSSSSSWTVPDKYDNKNGDFYLKDWDTKTIDNGAYDIRVTAIDNATATNSSTTENIEVNNTPNAPPEVTINVPKNGQTYNGTVQLNATATDEDGIITDVTFEYYDGSGWNSLGSNTSKSGNHYYRDWVTDSLDNGANYKIRANAIDNGTKTATDTTDTFSIDNSIYSSHLPELSDGGATPDNGITPQEFEFKVTYTDDDNESANYVRLVIEGVGPYDMSATDSNDPEDGIVYNYSKTLTTTTSSTKYKYHFIAQDANGSDAPLTSKKSVEVHPTTYYSGNRIWDKDANLSTNYTWNPQSFSGFYYDLDTDEGSETLTIKDIKRSLNKGDIEYITKPIPVDFENSRWGTYDVIGFMADRYFAGYNNTDFASSDDNLLSEEKLSKVLTDDDKKVRLNSGSVLELEDGYEFKITEFSSDGETIMVGLFKDGGKVDETVVNEGDNFVYEKDLGGAKDMPIIAIYIDNVFIGSETSSVNIEGIFQISDKYIDIERGDDFGQMTVKTVNENKITMENEDDVDLDEGDDFNLMGKINIIVADNNTLRFAPYVDLTEPDTYELRGTVTDAEEVKWTPFNFEALMYDIDTGEGDETLHLKRDGRTVDDGDLTYTINPITKNFEHSNDGWKSFESIGFMGEKYFAGYLKDSSFVSSDRSLISEGKLSKILIDEDEKHTMHIGNSLTLEEGYSLRIDEINRDGDAMMIALLKDGKEITTDIASEGDTYIYEVDVDGNDIPIILAHIDNVFSGMETNSIFIDGIFQISDSFTSVEEGDTYGIMEVTRITPSIVLSNEDDSISLDKGDVINIMGDIKIKVADDGNDIRFYPFQEIIVKEPLYLELDIPDSVYENEEFTISVTSDGDEVGNVSITFNDSEIGTTDSNGELIHTHVETGEFKVTASKSGYESDSDNIEILYQPKALEISAPLLVDRNETIVISVTSEGKSVSGVTVMFGSNDLGTTPESGKITHTPDQVGTHTITASKSGYQDASKDIDVTDPGAKLVYSNLTIEPKSVQPGENVNITVEAANFGTLRDADTMTVKVNGEEIATEDLVLAPGEIMTLEFALNRSKPGTYLVEVDGRSDTFKVMGSQFSSTAIVVLVILAILSAAAIIYSFAQGTLSSEIIVGKAQALKQSLMRLIER